MQETKEKGVSLIIIFFMMLVIIGIILSVSLLLYSEIKIVRNMSNSVVSFYAADSGIEKILFYDRKKIPEDGYRGLCYMCDYTNPSCRSDNIDPSLNCECQLPEGDDCNINTCTACAVSFTSNLGEGKTYKTEANVLITSGPDCGISQVSVKSYGFFQNASRAIQLDTEQNIGIVLGPGIDASGTEFRTVGQNEQIKVSVTSPDQITEITAYIFYSPTGASGTYTQVDQGGLSYVSGHNAWEHTFTEQDIGYYYVSIGAAGANGICASITVTPP